MMKGKDKSDGPDENTEDFYFPNPDADKKNDGEDELDDSKIETIWIMM